MDCSFYDIFEYIANCFVYLPLNTIFLEKDAYKSVVCTEWGTVVYICLCDVFVGILL